MFFWESRKSIRWNVERLRTLAGNMRDQQTKVQNDAGKIEQLKADITNSWQGVAGSNYIDSLNINGEEIKNAANNLGEISDKLYETAGIYDTAEQSIRALITNLSASIER